MSDKDPFRGWSWAPANTFPVAISRHARERYQQRYRPTLSDDAARREISLLLSAATVRKEPPPWLPESNAVRHVTQAWLMLGDDVCAPLLEQGDGSFVAATIFHRGSIPPETRRRRNERRRQRAAIRRDRRVAQQHQPNPRKD